eukprot:m.22532 g.22532  ORF g.22532 m.22532 type:complete len:226 (+) comp11262_c0_seq1:121-798(+)
MPNLGDIIPNFDCQSTMGDLQVHEYLGDSWGLFVSHPGDFTPVCTTELGIMAHLYPEFEARNVKVLCLSADSVDMHHQWTQDVLAQAGLDTDTLPFPILADERREISVRLGILDADFKDKAGIPLTARGTFIISPDKRIKFSANYPGALGRNFDELLRVIDAIQLIEYKQVCIPGNWTQGNECMPSPFVPPEEFENTYPKGVSVQDMPSGKEYMYYTPQPELDDN